MQKGIIVPDQKWVINLNGENQFLIHKEECAELIQAISKYQRYKTASARDQVIEEIADVMICIEQLKLMCNIWDEEIQGEVDYKCRRTKDRYEKEIKNGEHSR